MKRLLLVLATGFGLDGCASLTQKQMKIILLNRLLLRSILPLMPLKVLEHGIFTEQDIADMPEHSSINSAIKYLLKRC